MARKEPQASGAGGRCPTCKVPTDTAYRPFCSARCRDVDLARWLGGTYAIPGAGAAGEEGAAVSGDHLLDGDEPEGK